MLWRMIVRHAAGADSQFLLAGGPLFPYRPAQFDLSILFQMASTRTRSGTDDGPRRILHADADNGNEELREFLRSGVSDLLTCATTPRQVCRYRHRQTQRTNALIRHGAQFIRQRDKPARDGAREKFNTLLVVYQPCHHGAHEHRLRERHNLLAHFVIIALPSFAFRRGVRCYIHLPASTRKRSALLFFQLDNGAHGCNLSETRLVQFITTTTRSHTYLLIPLPQVNICVISLQLFPCFCQRAFINIRFNSSFSGGHEKLFSEARTWGCTVTSIMIAAWGYASVHGHGGSVTARRWPILLNALCPHSRQNQITSYRSALSQSRNAGVTKVWHIFYHSAVPPE